MSATVPSINLLDAYSLRLAALRIVRVHVPQILRRVDSQATRDLARRLEWVAEDADLGDVSRQLGEIRWASTPAQRGLDHARDALMKAQSVYLDRPQRDDLSFTDLRWSNEMARRALDAAQASYDACAASVKDERLVLRPLALLADAIHLVEDGHLAAAALIWQAFGQAGMTSFEVSSPIEVPPGEMLRLRLAVAVARAHARQAKLELNYYLVDEAFAAQAAEADIAMKIAPPDRAEQNRARRKAEHNFQLAVDAASAAARALDDYLAASRRAANAAHEQARRDRHAAPAEGDDPLWSVKWELRLALSGVEEAERRRETAAAYARLEVGINLKARLAEAWDDAEREEVRLQYAERVALQDRYVADLAVAEAAVISARQRLAVAEASRV